MKLYVSVRPFSPGKSGGIVGYLENLVQALATLPGLEIHSGHPQNNIRELGLGWPRTVERHHLHGVAPEIVAASEAALVKRLQPDWMINFYPYFGDFYPEASGTRVAACIPDIQHVHLGANFTDVERRDRDEHFGEAIRRADLIFTLSDFCRADIARHYPGAAGKIATIHPAAPHAWDQPASPDEVRGVRERLGLPERFALYNANTWPHKNHPALLSALQRLARRGITVPCVLTGSDPQGTLARQIAALGLADSVRTLGYVAESDLKQLMAAAEMLVFPSLFEGFGIPVLEAFGSGVPVACSNLCSLPEVGGDAAEYFDPRNPEDIARAIELLWSDADLREAYRSRGRVRYRAFSYEQSAATLVELLAQRPVQPPAPVEISVWEPPLVTVVTPSYQQGRFLRACIESVMSQDYPRVEYMVLDGGSKDESVEVLKSYGERFFWQSQPDGGQTQAINAGLARARGSILAYLNSDDVLLPGALARVADAFGRYPSADLIYGDADYIDEEGRVIRPYPTHPYDLERLKGLCFICQPAAFWTRKAWDRYGKFDETFNLAMDYEYWQRIAAGRGFIQYLPEKLACSRDYATTKTRGQRLKVYEDIFASQRKHWNCIHLDWWLGYVDYMANEAPWWVRIRTPKTQAKQLDLARKLTQESDRRPPETERAAAAGPQVSGIFIDGWLKSDFAAVVESQRERVIYLELFSPWTGNFTLTSNGNPVASHTTTGPARFRLEANLPAGKCTLQLSGPCHRLSEKDAREASALVVATNWL